MQKNRKNHFCDGRTRRHFLKVGALGMGGLALPQILRAEAAAGQKSSPKAVIMIFLVGGPSHLDMYDLKPDAPLEIQQEDPRLVARYGRGGPPNDAAYAPYYMDQFLMARRLVEAGVRCITISFGLWDTHFGNFTDIPGHGLKYSLPMLDQGVSALVQDLHDRGMQNDVSVVVWGEFGRSPRINKDAGRDHWPAVSSALLAGGGMRTGQVIGATDRLGESIQERPVHYQNVLATLYRNLGIDAVTTTIPDHSGRPQYLLEHQEPIQELI